MNQNTNKNMKLFFGEQKLHIWSYKTCFGNALISDFCSVIQQNFPKPNQQKWQKMKLIFFKKETESL